MACPTSARAALRASIRPLRTVTPSTTSSLHRRPYHSYDHPPPPGPFGATETAILAAAYKHVPEHGFTQTALTHGARDAGLPDISPSVLTNGPFTLIKYHLVTQRQALAERSRQLFERDDAPAGVGGKVAALTWERLLANKDIIHRWQEVRKS
jgi:ubiquinone biosynthesis protein COQ9